MDRMPARASFARAHAWWSWDHPDVVRAVRAAWLAHLLRVVRRALAANAAAGRRPDRLTALCNPLLIRRIPRNVDRVLASRYGASDGFRLALASALAIPVGQLFPCT